MQPVAREHLPVPLLPAQRHHSSTGSPPWETATQDYAVVSDEEGGESVDADERELRLVVDPPRSHLHTESELSP